MTTPTHPPAVARIADILDLTAEMVARRIQVWFDEREAWTREDLLIRSAADFIDIDSWHTHERVKATGLVILVLGNGPRDVVYVRERHSAPPDPPVLRCPACDREAAAGAWLRFLVEFDAELRCPDCLAIGRRVVPVEIEQKGR